MTETMKMYVREVKATYKARRDAGEFDYETYERKLEVLADRLCLSIFDVMSA